VQESSDFEELPWQYGILVKPFKSGKERLIQCMRYNAHPSATVLCKHILVLTSAVYINFNSQIIANQIGRHINTREHMISRHRQQTGIFDTPYIKKSKPITLYILEQSASPARTSYINYKYCFFPVKIFLPLIENSLTRPERINIRVKRLNNILEVNSPDNRPLFPAWEWGFKHDMLTVV
jgi:hypothetical protein